MEDCVFCKIIAGQIPSDIVYHDKTVIAFKDIHPVTQVHLLIVPREHIAYLTDLTEKQSTLVGHMILVANELARQTGIAEKGFRVVINVGSEGGQMVPHLHLHLLGGRRLSEKMG
ncbi:MAG: histidine triad nucleotide-binding protein [Dehalococcoidales bacterium]|nr:histidine triad nucleotide-binding protein [Dehalococcoidales bacterium]